MIAGKALDVKQVFNTILARNATIQHLLLLSYAGLPMVSTMASDQLESGLCAMAAGIRDIVCRFTADERQWRECQLVIITSTHGYLLLREIKGVGILVVVTATGLDWPKVQGQVDWLAAVIAGFKESATWEENTAPQC